MSFKKALLIIIILAGCAIRFQNFHLPPIDAHITRQTDTENVAYHFAFTNHNILYPQSSLIRPQGNTNGYFFLEFPTYGYAIGLLYRLFGYHIEVAHLFNIFLYIVAVTSLYIFVKKFIDERTALWSSFFYSFAPASIFFLGHAIHPDVFAVTLVLLALALYVSWKENKNIWLFVSSTVALTLSIGTRPFIILVVPSFVFLAWTYKAQLWEYPFLAFGGITFYKMWKWWQWHFPEADSTWEEWVLQGRDQLYQKSILIDRLILKNIVGEVVGKSISFFALLGVVTFCIRRNKVVIFLLLWLAGIPVYWYFAPNGNIIHQYYADVFLVPIVITAAYGVSYFLGIIKHRAKVISLIITAAIVLLVIYNGYRTSQYYFTVSTTPEQLKIASEIEKHIPKDGKTVYLATQNSVPLLLAHRKGWVLGAFPDVTANAQSVLDLRRNGASYVIAANGNTDMPASELNTLKKQLNLYYKSQWVEIYRFK